MLTYLTDLDDPLEAGGLKNFEIINPCSLAPRHLPTLTHPFLLSSLARLSTPPLLSILPFTKNPSL
jgi:hypothetical protein